MLCESEQKIVQIIDDYYNTIYLVLTIDLGPVDQYFTTINGSCEERKCVKSHQNDAHVRSYIIALMSPESGVALRPRRPGSVFTPNLQYAPNVGLKRNSQW